jgi:hypothetical protein
MAKPAAKGRRVRTVRFRSVAQRGSGGSGRGSSFSGTIARNSRNKGTKGSVF